jgi:hypothetical protein
MVSGRVNSPLANGLLGQREGDEAEGMQTVAGHLVHQDG